MKTKRLREYLKNKKEGNALRKKEDIANHPDQKIDEDFSGYPHGQSKEKLIKPTTAVEKKTAALDVKDGEKMQDTGGQESDGSAGAFSATEDPGK